MRGIKSPRDNRVRAKAGSKRTKNEIQLRAGHPLTLPAFAMADPVVSISAATSLGRNFATLNGSVTPNGTSRSWWLRANPEDGFTPMYETRSDTEYYFEFVNVNGIAISNPFNLGEEFPDPWPNVVDYPPVTTPIEATGSSPIPLAKVAYKLTPGTTYYVRLVAKRYLWPGSYSSERSKRSSQPFQLFFTAPVSFTLSTS